MHAILQSLMASGQIFPSVFECFPTSRSCESGYCGSNLPRVNSNGRHRLALCHHKTGGARRWCWLDSCQSGFDGTSCLVVLKKSQRTPKPLLGWFSWMVQLDGSVGCLSLINISWMLKFENVTCPVTYHLSLLSLFLQGAGLPQARENFLAA